MYTPMRGALTNKTLKRLNTEFQANASSIENDLRGEDPGGLGIFLMNE